MHWWTALNNTLIDLVAEEIGEDELVRVAVGLADETFASQQATQESSRKLLRDVFALRARRVAAVVTAGRLGWVKETGARVRLIETVENDLLPTWPDWQDVPSPTERRFVDAVFGWAWERPGLKAAAREVFDLAADADDAGAKATIRALLESWLAGERYGDMARRCNLVTDEMLRVHARLVAFALQTVVEQAVAVLDRILNARGQRLADAVSHFPEHLRYGVPTAASRILVGSGVRHRYAAVAVGSEVPLNEVNRNERSVADYARRELLDNAQRWTEVLGLLVYRQTVQDLS